MRICRKIKLKLRFGIEFGGKTVEIVKLHFLFYFSSSKLQKNHKIFTFIVFKKKFYVVDNNIIINCRILID